MTRTAAREIAVRLVYRLDPNAENAPDTLSGFFDPEYYETLKAEDPLFSDYPDDAQLSYISSVVLGVEEHISELGGCISKYSAGWRLDRISKIAVAIMETAMFELSYLSSSIPPSAAINEAVELAKRYEEPETAAFINGILGAFYREKFPDAEKIQLADIPENTEGADNAIAAIIPEILI